MTDMLFLLPVLLPFAILWLTHKSLTLRRVGEIVIAYAIGCVIGLAGLLPDGSDKLMTTIGTVAIVFAIPLMLLSSDVRAWRGLAPVFLKSTACGIGGCALAVVVAYWLFPGENPDMDARVGGMLTGLFTGGAANMGSLKVALGVPDDIYVLSHAYAIVLSAVYLLFVVVFGGRALGLVLRPFEGDKSGAGDDATNMEDHSGELFFGLFRRDNLPHLAKALGLTIAILAVGAGVAWCVTQMVHTFSPDADVFQAVFILGISMMALICAQNKRVRGIKRTYEAGTYFILVFSAAVSTQVRTDILEVVNPSFFGFICVATLGTLAMHVMLSRIFGVDRDTTLVTSISLICSPPFVPVMAGALGNKAVIGPGIAVGLFGYAIGTYVGFGVASLLLLI